MACTLTFLLMSCQEKNSSEKINGISLVASKDSLKDQQLTTIIKTNSNAVSLMPYAFTNRDETSKLIFDTDWQWFGETGDGIEHTIKLLKARNLQLMLKPHIWLRNGDFTGDLSFKNEAQWIEFESSYRDYILFYAQIAEKHHVELFCIGTELYNFVQERPEFWLQLITDVRAIYSGMLVYAENWDKVEKTQLWQHLDFIGVDAYFPLSDEASPAEEEIRGGWEEPKKMLDSLSEFYKKPILFTEYGYRNIDFALKEPWNSDRDRHDKNFNLQAKALKILYEEMWNEEWFAGGFIWKWHQHKNSGGLDNDQFTPQNKPAEKVLKKYYRKFSH
ncbi:glycoside hydrolase family 113 [Christiangramia aquimixticola]|uniref:glycoside hydrolase family 113 n=1 Tax=Christiangramia aquimixticola TaxID=1697558 RepID=UPI003AA8CA86